MVQLSTNEKQHSNNKQSNTKSNTNNTSASSTTRPSSSSLQTLHPIFANSNDKRGSTHVKGRTGSDRSKRNALSKQLFTRPVIQKLSTTHVKGITGSDRSRRNALPKQFFTRPVIKKLSTPVMATESPVVSRDELRSHEILFNYLTPQTRILINRLKYFELNNGDIYACYIGPYRRPKVIIGKHNIC